MDATDRLKQANKELKGKLNRVMKRLKAAEDELARLRELIEDEEEVVEASSFNEMLEAPICPKCHSTCIRLPQLHQTLVKCPNCRWKKLLIG